MDFSIWFFQDPFGLWFKSPVLYLGIRISRCFYVYKPESSTDHWDLAFSSIEMVIVIGGKGCNSC